MKERWQHASIPPGKLIQERQPYVESDIDGRPRNPNAERRVIAGEPTAGGYVDPVDFDPAFWRVLAPEEPQPGMTDIDLEVQRRERVAAKKAKRDKG